MDILKSNLTWAIILIATLALLYVQSLHGHIKDQAHVISNNKERIETLQDQKLALEKDLAIAKSITVLVGDQKEEFEAVKETVKEKVIVAKKKVVQMTKEEKSSGNEILDVWDMYELAKSGNLQTPSTEKG